MRNRFYFNETEDLKLFNFSVVHQCLEIEIGTDIDVDDIDNPLITL